MPDSEVHLVHWVDIAALEGRRVHLDDKLVLKYTAPWMCDRTPHANAVMLLPDIGAKMFKDPNFREKIPDDSLRLMRMYEHVNTFSADGAVAFTSTEECAVCGADKCCDDENVRQCSLCLLAFHDRYILNATLWPQQFTYQIARVRELYALDIL